MPTKPKTSKQVCGWDDCSALTGFRRDGTTPLKYCKEHTKAARQRFVENVIKPAAAEREHRDEALRAILDEAMLVGETAKGSVNPISSSRAAQLVLRPGNHRFVRFLVRNAIGDPVEGKGYVVRFPEAVGSVAQAQAIAGHLKPLTMSGEALEGLRISVG